MPEEAAHREEWDRVSASTPLPAHDDIVRVLALARRHLGLEAAWLARRVPETGRHVVVAVDRSGPRMGPRTGQVVDVPGTAGTCSGEAPTPGDAARCPDTGRCPGPRHSALGEGLHLGAYVAVPVPSEGGAPAGFLCCAGAGPRPDLARADLTVLKLLADVVAAFLSADGGTAALEALRRRTSGAISGRGRSLALQPVVDVLAGRATGVEALARFDSPQDPEVWFAQAEPVGLRLPLELAAARSALVALARPGRAGYLSVNLSAEAILSDGFDALVAAVDPRDLVVEITEHAAVEDYDALATALRHHRAAGLRIAVDDAGAGYASLRHILKLRPDFIKIDLSLVRDIHLDPARQALVTALVTFAATVGAVLVAEGVEEQAELDMLFALGVRYMQGYLLCAPCADPPTTGFPRPSRAVRAGCPVPA